MNKAQKRKYSEVSCKEYNESISNNSVKKKKKNHDLFPIYDSTINSKIKKIDLNETQNSSFKLLKKKKQKKKNIKKWDKDLLQNKTKLNSQSNNNHITLVEKKNASLRVSSGSSFQTKNVFSPVNNTKSDSHNFTDSVSLLTLKGKKKKKKRKKNKNLHQSEIYSSVLVKNENQPQLNKVFNEMEKNKKGQDCLTKEDTLGFKEDIKQNPEEYLNVNTKALKKKNMLKRKNKLKKLFQNQIPSSPCDLVHQGDDFKKSLEGSNRESDSEKVSSHTNTLFQSTAHKKLQAAKFRYLNEMLYTNTGKNALKYFQQNGDEFQDYHTGYQLQVSKWPLNPVDVIIKELCQM